MIEKGMEGLTVESGSDDDRDEMEVMRTEVPEEKWDCESILSK